MVHYTCDLCGRPIPRQRYTVNIEISSEFDPDEITEDDLDADHLEQISESIEAMQSTSEFDMDESEPQRYRYDLCTGCCKEFAKAPLTPVRVPELSFSPN